MRNFQRRLKRTRRGDFDLRLPKAERDLLRTLPSQLREVLPTDDPAVRRLFPPAYREDPELSEEYRRLVRDDLLAAHLEALQVMEATLDATRLTEDQLVSWLSAINDLRLVLGTRLDVTEESYEREIAKDDPNATAYALYFYLGWLEEQVVEALALGLDPAGTEAEPGSPTG